MMSGYMAHFLAVKLEASLSEFVPPQSRERHERLRGKSIHIKTLMNRVLRNP